MNKNEKNNVKKLIVRSAVMAEIEQSLINKGFR